MMMRSLVFSSVLLGSFAAASAGVIQKTSFTYFTVSGSSAGALYRSVVNNSQLKGARHTLATTDVSMEPRPITTGGASCRVKAINVALSFGVHLPRLSSSASLSPGLRRDWQSFAAHLATHEVHHRAIWMGCAAAYSRSLQSLVGSTCGNLNARMNAKWDVIDRSCRSHNAGFDADEQGRVRSQPFLRRVQNGG